MGHIDQNSYEKVGHDNNRPDFLQKHHLEAKNRQCGREEDVLISEDLVIVGKKRRTRKARVSVYNV